MGCTKRYKATIQERPAASALCRPALVSLYQYLTMGLKDFVELGKHYISPWLEEQLGNVPVSLFLIACMKHARRFCFCICRAVPWHCVLASAAPRSSSTC